MAAWKNRGLDSLEVTGYGASLSEDWFTAHVKTFSWDGVLFSAFCYFHLIFSRSKGDKITVESPS
jgi:hypothetical protein